MIRSFEMTIEIAMPLYKPSPRLKAVLTALSLQTDRDFYITMYNDTRPEDTEEIELDNKIIDEARNQLGLKISVHQNDVNLGYMKNMHQIFDKATGDILVLLADDDIVTVDYIEMVRKAFSKKEVGIVGRPYYWFTDDMKKPVRFSGFTFDKMKIYDFDKSNAKMVNECLRSAGQLSGLAFRREYLKGMPFEEDMFTAHVYPFLYVFKNHPCVYLPHPTLAVSINSSQTHKDIYDPSPMKQWIDLLDRVVPEKEHKKRVDEIKEYNNTDFYGLAEIKNYGTYKEVFTEIFNFVKYRPKNLINPYFYIFSIGSIIIPRKVLIGMVDWYKNTVLAKRIEKMNIDFSVYPFKECEPLWKYQDYDNLRD